MDKFLNDPPELNQDDTKYLNKCISSMTLKQSLKVSRPNCTHCRILLGPEKELAFLKLFHKTEKEEMVLKELHSFSITLVPRPEKYTITKRKIIDQSP